MMEFIELVTRIDIFVSSGLSQKYASALGVPSRGANCMKEFASNLHLDFWTSIWASVN